MTDRRLRRFLASAINVTFEADLDGVAMRLAGRRWALHSYTISDELKAKRFNNPIEAYEALVAYRVAQKKLETKLRDS